LRGLTLLFPWLRFSGATAAVMTRAEISAQMV